MQKEEAAMATTGASGSFHDDSYTLNPIERRRRALAEVFRHLSTLWS